MAPKRKAKDMKAEKPKTVEVLKSPNDRKSYRYLQLNSGLSVLLISDPQILVEDEDTEEEGSEGEEGEDDSADASDEGDTGDEDTGEGEDDEADEGGDGEEDEREGKSGKGPLKKAAAAMVVGVGSFSDPDQLPGLSHYLEHMLFMGSKKYPNENEYDQYLQQHGGSSNAYTELEYTNYHFEVSPTALRGALDRFAQFFLGPLVKADSMEREVCAVDSEFSSVQQDDHCRLMQLMCHTAVPDHIYRKFAWGNRKSLADQPQQAGIDVRAQLLKHYKEHYRAERMSLALLGGEDLDTLQSWVEEIFAKLPKGRTGRTTFDKAGPPFQGRMLYVAPAVRDLHEVSVTFQLPSLRPEYLKKSDHYISHLVGHEGPGSLLSALKSRGWANSLSAGIDEDGYSSNTCCSLFTVNITLTDAGLAAGPGLGLAAVGLLFQYLEMLRATGPQQWVWQEIKLIAEMKFRFAEEDDAMDYTSHLASNLLVVAPEHVLASESLHVEWDANRVMELLGLMHASTSSYRVDLQTRTFAEAKAALSALGGGNGAGVKEETEPWFGMEAAWMALPEEMTSGWAAAGAPPEMRLPPPNPYVASDFDVRANADNGAGPATECIHTLEAQAQALGLPLLLATPPDLLLDRPGLLVWHKLDSNFKTPRCATHFKLASPVGNATARGTALQGLLLQLLEDALTEDSYLADVAGLHYSTSAEGVAGIDIRVEGFSHKLPLLAQRIFSTLVAADFSPTAFDVVKETQLRKYRNMNIKVSKHANWARLYMLCRRLWHYEAVGAELERVTLADIKPFVQEMLSSSHLECLLHGNLTRSEATELATSLHGLLGAGCAMAAAERERDQCLEIAAGTDLAHRIVAKNADEENCCVEVYFQCCASGDDHDRAVIDLIDQLTFEPCYDTLRTKEQLGYSVASGVRSTHDVLGFCFTITSASHSPQHLEERILSFVDAFSEKLNGMAEAEFEQNKRSLLSQKLQRDRHLVDETHRHWDQIYTRRYDFFMREKEVAKLETVTLPQVREWFSKYMARAGPQRRTLTVHVAPSKACPAAATTSATTAPTAGDSRAPTLVEDLDAFKAAAAWWPSAKLGTLPAVVA